MNYEKKYKEAQKWIESIYSELSHEQQMEAEAFFPELKESEDVDKKIREEIIATIRLYYGKPLEDEAKEMIAWLEKQEGCEYIKKDWLEHIKQSWYKEGFIDGKYSGGTSKEWTINDAAIFKEIIDFLENGTAKLQHDLTRYANWLKIQLTPIKKQGEPTDINPSEFDLRLNKLLKQFETLPKEELANSLSFYLNVVQNDGTYKPDEEQGEQKPATIDIDKMVNDYTNNKERGNEIFGKPVPCMIRAYRQGLNDAIEKVLLKPAWSEEDEVKINRIVACLENLNVADNDILLKDVDWLKSLKYRYTWKPSDEQIKILNEILNFAANHESPYWNDYIFGTLNNLIRQLKKLIE